MGKVIMEFELGKPDVIHVEGVPGHSCRAFSKPFEEALGGRIVSDQPTAEMSQLAMQTENTAAKIQH